MLESAAVSAGGPSSYRSLLGNLREHVRAYLAKQLLLPRQEIRELIAANLRAAIWFGAAAALILCGAISLLVLLIALLALMPRDWLGAAVLGLAAGVGVALLVAGLRTRSLSLAAIAFVGALVLVGIGVLAVLFLPQLVLAALVVTLVLFAAAALSAAVGSRKLELRGPERSIRSVKETISWVKTTLLGRSES